MWYIFGQVGTSTFVLVSNGKSSRPVSPTAVVARISSRDPLVECEPLPLCPPYNPYPSTATALISTSSSGLASPLMMSSVFGG